MDKFSLKTNMGAEGEEGHKGQDDLDELHIAGCDDDVLVDGQ